MMMIKDYQVIIFIINIWSWSVNWPVHTHKITGYMGMVKKGTEVIGDLG